MLSFEVDLDLITVSRVRYNVIDMFSDIGGIQSILMTTFMLILSAFNHNNFDSYMAQRLYKLEKEFKSGPAEQDHTEFFSPSKTGNIKEYLMDALPKKWVCCRKTRH